MIAYDPKSWLKVTFAFRGTIIPRVAARVGVLAGLTAAVLVLRELIPNAELWKPFKPLGHTLIGVALGLLIVFRNNCSYDRYWEGRKLWGGIVNASRNLVREAAAFAGDASGLVGLVTAYPLALKQHLRGLKDFEEIRPLVSTAVFEHASAAANPPSVLAYYMSAWVREQVSRGKIDTVTAQAMEGHIRTFLDNQGGCERILRTPIPFAYAVHIKQLLMIYLITLPVILVGELGWVAIPAVAAIGFGLLGIEEAGVEIEDPFGDDPNDLPLEAMCSTIGRDAQALADAPKAAG
ncbi:MAG TPA: bestrophin family ion channel [Gemmataceae bacterium]|nr:bestrophin family ion channel [Gemmataceae bacterium]